MQVVSAAVASVVVAIDPSECLLLSRACECIRDSLSDISKNDTHEVALYNLFADYLAALAMIGDVHGHIVPADSLDEWTPATVRETWTIRASTQPYQRPSRPAEKEQPR